MLIVSRDDKQLEVNLPAESFEFQDVLISINVNNFVNERSPTSAHSELTQSRQRWQHKTLQICILNEQNQRFLHVVLRETTIFKSRGGSELLFVSL